jgi:hypothetical protein
MPNPKAISKITHFVRDSAKPNANLRDNKNKKVGEFFTLPL